ncbi:MAG: tRNA-guanine transglycosylase [Chitinophagaceae bacterium]
MPKKNIINEKKIIFFPSISMDKKTWVWKNKIDTDGLLVSYDVLFSNKKIFESKKPLGARLGYKNYIIIDSGAFGHSQETNPLVVYQMQKKAQADIAILLDKIPPKNADQKKIDEAITITLNNAKMIQQINNNELNLMAVIQGNTIATQSKCAKAYTKMGYKIIGIPMSTLSKYRRYTQGIEKVLNIKKLFPSHTIFHALGCGSRTMIAILSVMGVTFFDSSAYYKAAMYGEAIKPISMCSIGKAGSKPECKYCLKKQRVPKSYAAKVNYNVREILKEIQRSRCAKEMNVGKEYLEMRLKKNLFKKILKYL